MIIAASPLMPTPSTPQQAQTPTSALLGEAHVEALPQSHIPRQGAVQASALIAPRLVIELDTAAKRFVQMVIDNDTVIRRFPDERQLAFSRGVNAYVNAMRSR